MGGAQIAAVGEELGSSTLGKAHGGQVEQRLVPLLPLPPPAWNPPSTQPGYQLGSPSVRAREEGLYPACPECTPPWAAVPDSPVGIGPAWGPACSASLAPSQRLQGPPAGEPLLTTPVTPPVTPKCSVSQS